MLSIKNNYQELGIYLKSLGGEAYFYRHEIYYFINESSNYITLITKAIRGIFKDLFILLRMPDPLNYKGYDNLYFSSLSGASGKETLIKFYEIESKNSYFLTLNKNKRFNFINLMLLIKILKNAFKSPGSNKHHNTFLFLIVLRSNIWKEYWYLILKDIKKVFVMNDVDVYNKSLISVAKKMRIEDFCIQQGILTEELLPPYCSTYIVWSEWVKTMFQHSYPDQSIIIKNFRFRNLPILNHENTPKSINIISQTHANIFSTDLHSLFNDLASNLEINFKTIKINILLHPSENADSFYRSKFKYSKNVSILKPPHKLFSINDSPEIVIGFCSTALIDSAFCGHYVLRFLPTSSDHNSNIAESMCSVFPAFSNHELLSNKISNLLNSQNKREKFLSQQLNSIKTFLDNESSSRI